MPVSNCNKGIDRLRQQTKNLSRLFRGPIASVLRLGFSGDLEAQFVESKWRSVLRAWVIKVTFIRIPSGDLQQVRYR